MSETFDGQMVIVPGDSELNLRPVTDSGIFLQDASGWRPLSSGERDYAHHLSMVSYLEQRPANQKARYDDPLERYSALLKKDRVSSGYAELLREGRLKVLYLLNTHGGFYRDLISHLGMTGMVKRGQGSVAAIGGSHIYSCGAQLFMESDSDARYLQPHSRLLFHLPDTVSDPELIYSGNLHGDRSRFEIDGIARQERLEAIAKLRQLLTSSLKGPALWKVGRLLTVVRKRPPFPGEPADDCPIEFFGRAAAKAGLCKLTTSPSRVFKRLTGTDGYGDIVERFC